MSVADEQMARPTADLDSEEERNTMITQHEDQPRGQRIRLLVAEIGYRLVSLGAWLERFGPKQPES
jgi:hypothetical protein